MNRAPRGFPTMFKDLVLGMFCCVMYGSQPCLFSASAKFSSPVFIPEILPSPSSSPAGPSDYDSLCSLYSIPSFSEQQQY